MAGKTKTLKNYLLTGILVSAPLAITIYLAVELVCFIDEKWKRTLASNITNGIGESKIKITRKYLSAL